ncbi:MAG: Gfo/Idh/MocA family oxidoreductase [Planctomycetia bacterium]|nr:Gfo/Idh/MocA family oxidoreductase [Planctomycetia bacterium]
MNERKLNWAWVGLGDVVRKRVGAALLAQPNSVLRSCVTRDPAARTEELALLQPTHVHARLDDALADPAIDAVYLATPVNLHAPQAIAALRAGKHVLVEKPMALDDDQAAQMVAAASDAQRHLAVAYYRRFWPTFARLKDMLDAAELGQIVLVRVALHSWYAPRPDNPNAWRVRRDEAGGGVLADVGSHRLDLLAWWFGLPRRVVAHVATRTQDFDVDDSVAALMTFGDGAPCTASFHWNSSVWVDELEIVGTKAKVALAPLDGAELVVSRGRDSDRVSLPAPSNAHYPLIDDFASAITERRTPRFTGSDGIGATRIIDWIKQSATHKAWVEAS